MSRPEPMPAYWANAFWFPKSADREHDWEDACRFDAAHGRFAIADGAASSYRAREWARLLVDGYVDRPPEFPPGRKDAAAAWFSRQVQTWERMLAEETAAASRSDDWWEQPEIEQDAYATFLGVSFAGTPDGLVYSTLCVGDCCLFHLRGDALLGTFPLSTPQQFTRTPDLVASRPGPAPIVHTLTGEGPLLSGDVLLLATDALAKTLIEQNFYGNEVWDAVRSVDHEDFRRMVVEMRAQQAIDIDDVTMLRITFVTRRDDVPNEFDHS